MSIAAFGQRYLAIINPLNTALGQLGTTLKNIPASDTGPQVQTAVDPTITALSRAQNRLLAVHWPAVASSDVHALVVDIGTVNGDLESFNGLTTAQQATNLTDKLLQDLNTGKAEAGVIRSDLDLPTSS